MRHKSESDFVPAYFRLQKIIQKEIETGNLEPGASILPERQLAELHQVSVGTVKKAILNLVNEGFLYRRQGKGTFVAGTKLRRESLRYYRCVKNFSSSEANLKIKFLECNEISDAHDVATALKIRKKQPIIELKRLFYTNNRPIIYSISYLPKKMFPGLIETDKFMIEMPPIYLTIERDYGLPTIANHELFSVSFADTEIANYLNLDTGHPLLSINMLAYTYKNKVYEFRKSFCKTDNSKILREW